MLALVLAALLAQPAPPAPPAPEAPAAAAPAPPPARRADRAAPAPKPPRAPAPPVPPSPPGVLRGEWPAQPSGKRVTIDDTTSIDDALETIADAAGWNVVLNTGRTGNKQLVLKLRDVPVEDALESAMAGTELVATRRGNTVVVAPAGAPVEERPVLSGFDRPTGKKFTGEFQDEDAGAALKAIAKAAGLSIVLPPGPRGKVTASFTAVPVEEALRAVLDQAGLGAERQGSMLVVAERTRGFRGFRGLPPDVGRQVDEAMRDARREMRDAERQTRDLPGRRGGHGRDRVHQGDVTVHAGEQVDDVVALRGSVKLEPGAQARSVVAILGNVTLAGGARAREATAIFGDVQVGPGAEVEKDATAVGGKVQADPAAEIGGESTSVSVPGFSGFAGLVGPSFFWGHADSPLFAVGQVLARFAVYFALGLLLLALFPRRVDGVAASMTANPVKAILVGLLGTVATPILTVLLVVTVIGILLVPVQALLVVAAGVLGFTALSFHVGRSLPLRLARGGWVLQLAIGTAIVVLVTQIPIVGGLAMVTGWLLVFGAVLRSRFGGQPPVLPTTVVAAPPPAPPAAPA